MNPKLIIFIHLNLICLLGFSTPILAQNTVSDALVASENSPLLDAGPWKIEPGMSVRLKLRVGKSIQGLVSSYSLNGFSGGFGEIHWDAIDPADRLRTFRELLRKSGRDDHMGLKDLAVVLLAIGDSPQQSVQILNRLRSRAGAGLADGFELEVREDAKKLRASWDVQKNAQEAQKLQSGLYHVRHVETHGTQTWNLGTPSEQDVAAEEIRRRIAQNISGLRLRPAQGRSVIVFGSGDTLSLARTAVELDEVHEKLSGMLGLADRFNVFSGVASMVVLPNSDDLRLIAAELYNQKMSSDSPGMLFIESEHAPSRPAAGQKGLALHAVPEIPVILTVDMEPSRASIEHARLYISAVLHRHHSNISLPPWLEAGFIEYVADELFPDAGIDARRRPRGLESIRRTNGMNWLLNMSADDPRMGSDGDARDLSYILVGRLFKANPDAFRTLVHQLKKGLPLNTAWIAAYGVRTHAFLKDSIEWFQFND